MSSTTLRSIGQQVGVAGGRWRARRHGTARAARPRRGRSATRAPSPAPTGTWTPMIRDARRRVRRSHVADARDQRAIADRHERRPRSPEVHRAIAHAADAVGHLERHGPGARSRSDRRGRRASSVQPWRARARARCASASSPARDLDDPRAQPPDRGELRRVRALRHDDRRRHARARAPRTRRPGRSCRSRPSRRRASALDLAERAAGPPTASHVPRPLNERIGLIASTLTTIGAPARSLSPSETNCGESRNSGGTDVYAARIASAAQDRGDVRGRHATTSPPRSTARGRRSTPRSADGSPSTTTRSANRPASTTPTEGSRAHPRRLAGRGRDRLHRREPHLAQDPELAVDRDSAVLHVGADDEPAAGGPEPPDPLEARVDRAPEAVAVLVGPDVRRCGGGTAPTRPSPRRRRPSRTPDRPRASRDGCRPAARTPRTSGRRPRPRATIASIIRAVSSQSTRQPEAREQRHPLRHRAVREQPVAADLAAGRDPRGVVELVDARVRGLDGRRPPQLARHRLARARARRRPRRADPPVASAASRSARPRLRCRSGRRPRAPRLSGPETGRDHAGHDTGSRSSIGPRLKSRGPTGRRRRRVPDRPPRGEVDARVADARHAVREVDRHLGGERRVDVEVDQARARSSSRAADRRPGPAWSAMAAAASGPTASIRSPSTRTGVLRPGRRAGAVDEGRATEQCRGHGQSSPVRARRGFSTVISWICSSLKPSARSRGRKTRNSTS